MEALLIVPIKWASLDAAATNTSETISGLGNLTFGLKYKIYDQKWKISTVLKYQANTSKNDSNTGLSTDFNANTFVPFISTGTSTTKWYYFGAIGYGYMTNNYSDYVRFTAEMGYNMAPQSNLILAFDTKKPITKEAAFQNNGSKWPSCLDQQTYNTIGLKFNYEFSPDKF